MHQKKKIREKKLPAQFSRTTRALANDTSKYALLAWLLSVVLLAGWLIWFFFGKVTVYEISSKARLEVQQAPHAVASLIAGRIAQASVVLGQEVRAGEVLFQLDAGSDQLRLNEEESRLAAIPPRIDSLEREIALMERSKSDDLRAAQAAMESARFRTKEASAAVEFARDNERRLQEESKFGSVAKMEAWRARAEAQKLSASREALSSDVQRLESDAQARVREHQAAIENLHRTVGSLRSDMHTARATIARLQADIDKHSIRAPISGRLGEVLPVRAGAYVAEGQKLATVVPGGALVIVAEFDPSSVLGRVHSGQLSRMRLDGFPWAQYGAIDAKVSRVASEIRDGQVRVEFSVDPVSAPRAVMQHGLPGSIEVAIDRATPAVLVLRAAGQMMAVAPRPGSPVAVRTP